MAYSAHAQNMPPFSQKALEKTKHFYGKLANHVTGINRKILKRTARFEQKMYRRLKRKDPVLAKRLFEISVDSLQNMRNRISTADTATGNVHAYFPGLDTMKNALLFLQQEVPGKALPNNIAGKNLLTIKSLESRFSQSAEIKQYLAERKEVLQQKLNNLPGFGNQLKKYKQHLDGYNRGIQEWKTALSNPKKIEEKALEWVKKIPAFQKFMQEHGELARLFGGVNINNAGATAVTGLQTRASVTARMQTVLSAGGPNAQAVLQQQMGMAQQQLNRLKEQTFSSASAADMPGYGAKNLKYKRLVQRLQPGANIQFSKSNRYFPATADLALQLAYQFSEKGTFGIGTSYKLGFGTGWNHIRFTAQGLGLRGFADFKLKGNFFINGGFEQNQFQPGNSVLLPQGNRSIWASSALLGISKKFNAGKRLKASATLLYDFLYKQTPGAQPVKYRMGYYFK